MIKKKNRTSTQAPSLSSSSFNGVTFGSQSLLTHDCNAKNPVPSHGVQYPTSNASRSGPVTFRSGESSAYLSSIAKK